MESIVLKNDNKVEVTIMSHGARIAAVKVPTETGELLDVALGFDTQDEFIKGDHYMGAICGRVANRIAGGKFELEGKSYQLAQNNDTNHLHGGEIGYSNLFWSLEACEVAGAASACKLTLVSEDGDQGYPGKLSLEAVYSLNNNNQLRMDLSATTDKTTIVNLTGHPYFNLKGMGNGDVLDHTFEVNAVEFTPLSDNGTTNGEIRSVAGTPMDLNTPVLLSEIASSDHEQIQFVGGGIDHNWLINKPAGELAFAGRVALPGTKRTVEVLSTQPGLQAYLGMHFDGTLLGKSGAPFVANGGIALEAQGIPNAINCPSYPSVVVTADAAYEETIIYKFGF